MKFNRSDIIISIVLLLISSLCLSLVFFDQLYFRFAYGFASVKNPIAQLSNIIGDVRVKAPDYYQWIPAQANMQVGSGYQIFSAGNSSVDVEANTWSAHVAEKSFLYIDNLDDLNRVSVDGGNFKFQSTKNDVVLKVCDESLGVSSEQTSLTGESSCLTKPKINLIKGKIQNTKKLELSSASKAENAPGPEAKVALEAPVDLEKIKLDIIRKKKPELIRPENEEVYQFVTDESGNFISNDSLNVEYQLNSKLVKLKVPALNFLNKNSFETKNQEITLNFEKNVDETWSLQLINTSIESFVDLKSDKKTFKVIFTTQQAIPTVKPILAQIYLDQMNYQDVYYEWQKEPEHVRFNIEMGLDENFSRVFRVATVADNRIKIAPVYKNYFIRAQAIAADGRKSKFSEITSVTVNLGELKLTSATEFILKNNESTVPLEFLPLKGIRSYGFQISKTEDFQKDSILRTKTTNGKYDFKFPETGIYFWRAWPVNEENLSLSNTTKIGKINIIKVKRTIAPSLASPQNKSTQYFQSGKEIYIHLKWNTLAEADEYEVQLATDEDFQNIVISEKSKINNKLIYFNQFFNKVYWRVRASGKAIETSDWSESRSLFFYKE